MEGEGDVRTMFTRSYAYRYDASSRAGLTEGITEGINEAETYDTVVNGDRI